MSNIPANIDDTFNDNDKAIILDMVASGCTLSSVAKTFSMSYFAFRKKLEKNLNFKAEIEQARAYGADFISESLLEESALIDDPKVAKVRFDVARWYLSKHAVEKFGDRIQVDTNEQISVKVALDRATNRLDDRNTVEAQLVTKDTGNQEVITSAYDDGNPANEAGTRYQTEDAKENHELELVQIETKN